MLTPSIPELRKLLAAATPGPWAPVADADEYRASSPDDARLIVAAVNALPALLDRLQAAEGERDAAASFVRVERWCCGSCREKERLRVAALLSSAGGSAAKESV